MKRLLIVVAVVALVGLVIWAAPSRVTILRVFLDRATTLQATGWANSCGGDLSVAVRETSNEVRVTVRDHRLRIKLLGGAGCADVFAFTLAAKHPHVRPEDLELPSTHGVEAARTLVEATLAEQFWLTGELRRRRRPSPRHRPNFDMGRLWEAAIRAQMDPCRRRRPS